MVCARRNASLEELNVSSNNDSKDNNNNNNKHNESTNNSSADNSQQNLWDPLAYTESSEKNKEQQDNGISMDRSNNKENEIYGEDKGWDLNSKDKSNKTENNCNDKTTTNNGNGDNANVSSCSASKDSNIKLKSSPSIVDKNVIFIQIQNFSQKIDEYISDERIFTAQKLIEHVKKYVEYYIEYFKKINDNETVEKLMKYYDEELTDKNINYNINNLKVNILFYFLSFFRLNDMSNMLKDYSYYFSLDPINKTNSETTSGLLENNNSTKHSGDTFMNRKSSIQSCFASDFGIEEGGGPSNSSANYSGIEMSRRASMLNTTLSSKDLKKEENCNYKADKKEQEQEQQNTNRNSTSSNMDDQTNKSNDSNNAKDKENRNIYFYQTNSLINSKKFDERELNEDFSTIVDKVYHQHYNNSNFINYRRRSFSKKSVVGETTVSRKGSNLHMVKIIKKYSRKLKNFRRAKQNKEGWIKENDKYFDLWHSVDSENNITIHIRAKLSYDVKKILSILSETELSTNWAPFLTSANKIKHLSKSSALISQMYEYPIIGKKESLMYCLGANSLEELGCIILCCKAPPEMKKDISFYQDMCEQLNINKDGEILKVNEIPVKFRKTKSEVTFFDCKLPEPIPKIDRQRAANLCFLLYPLNDGNSTVLELFVHFENEFKYTPIKMVLFFIKKIVKNMYENIIKSCKNYDNIYADTLTKNSEFYDWLDNQLKRHMKNKNGKLMDSVSLESYIEPENNEEV
ncbi:hypothetical protein, conserved [Plasmodium malariae]|uniref:START domain-containing protein n=1 Tax=Plasmodium malariae TaxID=5858 RepID=A0A1A8VWG3_PLAMA|nr:hypothetical protein, conserved [Plasmodium malariae]